MNITTERQRLEKAGKILDGLYYFQKQREVYVSYTKLEIYQQFPDLITKYNHKVFIYTKCTSRLLRCYRNLIPS